jgi:hypothetical protein
VAIVAGTGLYASFIDDRDGYRETWALIEACAFSGVTAEALGCQPRRRVSHLLTERSVDLC